MLRATEANRVSCGCLKASLVRGVSDCVPLFALRVALDGKVPGSLCKQRARAILYIIRV